MKKKVTETHGECSKELMAIKDAMDVLSGKWKIQIIGSLMNYGSGDWILLKCSLLTCV